MGSIDKKIFWVESARRFSLAARAEIQPRGWEVGLTETEMNAVQDWVEEHNCGRRISFDTFQFKNKKEMTMFLLRWG
jgi:uncharacterized protein YbdZ (MbtH family)